MNIQPFVWTTSSTTTITNTNTNTNTSTVTNTATTTTTTLATPPSFDVECSANGASGSGGCNLNHAANVMIMVSATVDSSESPNNCPSASALITGATVGGTGMTFLRCHSNSGTIGNVQVVFYYYKTGAANDAISVSFNTTHNFVVVASSYTGVKSTSSFESQGSAGAAGDTVSSATAAYTVASGSANRLVYESCSIAVNHAPKTVTTTVNSPLTSRATDGYAGSSGNYAVGEGSGDDQSAGSVAGTCGFSWTSNYAYAWNMIGVGLLTASSDVTSTLTLTTTSTGTATTTITTTTRSTNSTLEPTVTFTSNLTSDVAAGTTVLTIDSTPYTKSALPALNWLAGSTHTVACSTPLTGTLYAWTWMSWTNGDGLST